MARFIPAFLLVLASVLQECFSLGDPDLSVQVGYWSYTLYTIVLYINTPTNFPTSDEWQFLMTFGAYSVDATSLPENSDTTFTCLHQCETFSAEYYMRILFMESEAAVAADEECRERSGEEAYQPLCFPDDVSGRDDFERLVVGDWFWPGYYDTTHVNFIHPIRHLPEGESYSVGGSFSIPTPMVPSQASNKDLVDKNFWTITFNVWAQLKATAFDTICIAGYGMSESTGLCEACPLHSYRPVHQYTSGDCWLCPQNSSSSGIAEILFLKCICDGGFDEVYTASLVSEEAREGRTTEKYCLACSAGEYGFNEACWACPAGFYSSTAGASECTATTPGHYQPASNQTTSLPCEAGTYTGWYSATSCEPCADGYYQGEIGSSACEAAPAGYYTNGTGAAELIPCSAGYYQDSAGAGGSCSMCPAGRYSAVEAAVSCTAAAPGYYTSEAGQIEAFACSPGTFSATSASTACTECSQGSFVSETGATKCELTPPGYFQNFTGQTTGIPCAAGEYSASPGAATCEACPAGYYSQDVASASCVAALPGSYQNSTGQTKSLFCEPGSYSGSSGTAVCSACEPGTYTNQSGSSRCNDCQEGYYQDLAGQTSENPCPPGSYNPSAGMSTCFACDPGQNQTNYAQVRCENCPRGTYGDDVTTFDAGYSFQTRTVYCNQCPTISTTEEVGSESIEHCLCPDGTWGERTLCNSCSEGMLCDEVGLEFPKQQSSYQVLARASRRVRRASAAESEAVSIDVWKCLSSDACPSGPAGTCAENRDPSAIACGKCLDDYHFDGNKACVACDGRKAALLALVALIVGSAALVCLAFMANRRLATQSKAMRVLLTCLGMAVAALQIMSIFVKLSVDWKDPLKFCLELLSLLSFDLSKLNLECIIGSNYPLLYGLRQAVPPFGVLLVAIILLCKRRWYDPELRFHEEFVNTVGATMQMVSISLLISITVPFVCYEHPNGKSSMVDHPEMLCFDDSGHLAMATIGIVACCTVVLPFIVLVLHGVFRLPAAKRSSPSMMAHLRMFKFLFLQYEPHAYYFGLVTLGRGLLVCLVPVVVRDEGAAQILAIAIILLGFQISVRFIQPWSSNFCNGLDGFLAALMILILLCVQMSGNFDNTDELLSIGGMIFFIAAVLAIAFSIVVNLQWFLRPHPFWSYFICHHKSDAGAQARYLQLTFVQMTGKNCFIDSDHLANLDTLFDIVRSKIGHLVVYLSSDTLKRPWCAGEVTVAYLSHKKVIPVYTLEFVKPWENAISAANIPEYIAKADLILSEYGIGDELLSQAFNWVLGDSLHAVHVRTTVGRRLRLVGVVEDCTGGVSKEVTNSMEVRATRSKTSTIYTLQDFVSGYVVIAADHTDDEACAGAGIVMLKIYQKVVEFGIVGVNLLHEYPHLDIVDLEEVPLRAQSLIIVLSKGSLKLDMQLHLIVEAMKAIDTGITVLPLTLPRFKFPTESYFTEYLPQHFGAESRVLAAGLKGFFKRIAVQLATHSSDQVLDAQSIIIFDRLNKSYTAGKHHKSLRQQSSQRSEDWLVAHARTSELKGMFENTGLDEDEYDLCGI